MNTVRALLDLLSPVRCAGCRWHGAVLCPGCAQRFSGPARLTSLGETLLSQDGARALPVAAVTDFSGSARRTITTWKDADVRSLSPLLGDAVAAAVRLIVQTQLPSASAQDPASRGPTVLLVPVPSARSALRRRGWYPVGDLCRFASLATSHDLGIRVHAAPVLGVSRSVRDQSRLNVAARRRNVEGAFEVSASAAAVLQRERDTPGVQIAAIIVDDVLTTGATVGEAARALRECGVDVLAAAALCLTVRRLDSSSLASSG